MEMVNDLISPGQLNSSFCPVSRSARLPWLEPGTGFWTRHVKGDPVVPCRRTGTCLRGRQQLWSQVRTGGTRGEQRRARCQRLSLLGL